MSLIQFVILLFLIASLFLTLLVMRHKTLARLFFLLQFIIGAVFTIFPDISTRVATFLGVGRGTDLLLYGLIIMFYASTLLVISKFRKSEQIQTAIIRELALNNAVNNTKSTHNSNYNKN